MAVASGTLFASSYHTAVGTLYSVNVTNGSLTAIGSSYLDYDDFGWTTSGLYAIGVDANLYSISAITGAPTLIGSTGLGFGSWLSLSTNSSTLYFADGASLYTLNTTTGAATLVGNMGGPEEGAMVFEAGVLYGGADSPAHNVDTLNIATGAATTGPALTGASGNFYALAPFPIPTASGTPEPATWSLLGAGITALALRRRQK